MSKPWWETLESDPWYITGAKALLGEREVEAMQRGEVMPWVEAVSPLLFMGRGPRPRPQVELPPPPRIQQNLPPAWRSNPQFKPENMEPMDVMPVPSQPSLNITTRANILQDKLIEQQMRDLGIEPPPKTSGIEDFKSFIEQLPPEEGQVPGWPPGVGQWAEPPPGKIWRDIELPRFDEIYPGVEWNPGTMRWELPGRGALGPLEPPAQKPPEGWPLGTESWGAPIEPSKPPDRIFDVPPLESSESPAAYWSRYHRGMLPGQKYGVPSEGSVGPLPPNVAPENFPEVPPNKTRFDLWDEKMKQDFPGPERFWYRPPGTPGGDSLSAMLPELYAV